YIKLVVGKDDPLSVRGRRLRLGQIVHRIVPIDSRIKCCDHVIFRLRLSDGFRIRFGDDGGGISRGPARGRSGGRGGRGGGGGRGRNLRRKRRHLIRQSRAGDLAAAEGVTFRSEYRWFCRGPHSYIPQVPASPF